MSVRRIKAGTTDVSITVRVVDSADGTPETSVAFDTVGVDLWYRRDGAASVDITEATLAALTTAHTDGGFLHINDGWCRLDLPDAACATGVPGVQVGGTFTGMVVLAPYIELPANVDADVYSDTTIIASQLSIVKSDTSDIRSSQVIIKSDLVKIESDAAAIEVGVSDTESALVKVYSDTTIVVSDTTKIESDSAVIEVNTSDTESALVKVYSDTTKIHSDTTAIEAGGGALTATQASQLTRVQSDIISQFAVVEPYVSDIHSDTTAMHTQTTTIASNVLILKSDTSDIKSSQVKIYSDTTVIEVAGGATAAQIADAVWDEGRTDHTTAGSFGQVLAVIRNGTAQAGAAGTITLDASASASDDFYNGHTIDIKGGTGALQTRLITDYVGSTKVATIDPNWGTNPGADSVFVIYPTPAAPTTAVPAVNLVQVAGSTTNVSAMPSNIAAIEVGVSDTESALVKVYSDTTVIASDAAAVEVGVSDTESALVKVYSDTTAIHTQTTTIASNALIIKSDTSDVKSHLVKIVSDTTAIHSDTTHVHSDTTAIHTQTTTVASNVLVIKSDTSDIRSSQVIIKSDLTHIDSDTTSIDGRIPAALNNGVMPADMQRINDVAVTGDGSGTPFNV